jgi:hypothetical protein
MKRSGTWWTLGLILVAAACLGAWLIGGPSTPEADEPSTGTVVEMPPPQPTVVQTELVQKPAEPAKPAARAPQPTAASPEPQSDIFSGPMPDFMVSIRDRVLEKRFLDVSDQKQLYEYGKEHKEDARPQLLLAWDARNREWDGITAQMYRIAYRADKRVKEDPNMLPDLLAIASQHDRMEFDEASGVIQDAYGAQALPRIEADIAEARQRGQDMRVTRLNRLRDNIRAR